MHKKFVQALRERFAEGLKAKTGWGKNEVLALFEQVLTDTLADLADGAFEKE